ncbi:cell division protein FtsH [Candidatus Saccharibacteria bacterium RIFCSPHIGHO2_12_FULL_49_19]|nr:MAG: cell division protein FtsH [Candidatus Saccharibacteria bacterium RIFCSPHIGHO2_01_FULL_49_21]OGL36157.1 MAG: cell division protein FtsH [Candidatus Saccharibacteria bacterium RIFCSPHIGHO2_12_FULL_49_19]OGL38511.1 MAG: cell division protein FtsH [Candidatus Saccharibacteria bacterium RIFCSPLOWO2_01_FULL_49_22]
MALIVLFGLITYAAFNQPSTLKEVPFSETISEANSGQLKRIEINGAELTITPQGEDHPTEKSYKEEGSSIYEQGLEQGKVEVINKPQSSDSLWLGLLTGVLPVIIIAAILILMFRSAQGQGNQALSFGKSRARLYGNEKDRIKFKDVAGNDEAKQDLEEVVEFLKYPKKFEGVGAKIPKGVLLIGPPGTGKTMLARAVAGEANAPFFSISGSEFVEMFVGVGASRVRDLFNKAKKNAPCIIFIDEIDAVGRRRGSGMGGGHDEREQTLNQILVEMDGFEQGQNVIVLAATNRSDVLDPALLRPGRFDRRVNIDLPDRKDRELILRVHFAEKPISKDVDLNSLAAKTAGSSGADLANIANEAAIVAARHNRKVIEDEDVVSAFEKVAIGPERKSKIMSDKEKELTAYHEAGHAIVGHVLPDSDMVHKVTIIPRGPTGGVTWFIPPEDKSYHSIIEFKDVLARMLGGRVAEELIYGSDRVTTGAGSDLQKAAELARDMVVNQGMGKKLRNQVFHVDEGMMLERLVHERNYSDETAKIIDGEVESLITEATNRARAVVKANIAKLEALKEALLKKETVEAEEVKKILDGSRMPRAAALY